MLRKFQADGGGAADEFLVVQFVTFYLLTVSVVNIRSDLHLI